MTEFIKNRWVLLIVLTVFIICKIPHLHYAYYWDECWPYATAIKDMYRHGISLMPNAVDPDMSRGHPLLFHASAALWMNIFGGSHIAMHSFAQLLSVVFLVLVYEAGLRLFNKRVAITALLLVAMQVMFFVQSSFVLPEMMVGLFVFAAMYLYVQGRYLFTAIALTALFFTKESGLIAGFVLGLDAVVSLFNKSDSWKVRLSRLLAIAVPCLLILAFLLYQKHLRGWYIYPLHNELISYKWGSFWYSLRMNCMFSVFVLHSRYVFFLPMLALAVLAAIKNKKIKFLAILLPAVIIYYYVDDTRAGRILPPVPFFITFILSIALLLYSLIRLNVFQNARQQKIIVLSVVFVFLFLCFSSLVFFTPRYLVEAIVPLLFFAAFLYDAFIIRAYRILFYPILLLLLCAGFYSFKVSDSYGDTDTGAFDAMQVQQDVVDYFEKSNLYDKSIGCLNLENQHLADPNTGFLHSDKAFKKSGWNMDKPTEYLIFDNIENDPRYEAAKKDSSLHLVQKFVKGKMWAEIYQR